MRRPVTVLVYPVRRVGADWEYLLLHRVAGRGGFWQGVTGCIEEGEDLHEAARRELIEETRLVPSLIEGIDYSYSFPVEDKWRYLYPAGVEKITEYVFIAHVDGRREPEIDPVEHDGWKWCRFSDALELLNWPGNIEALKRCNSVVRTSS